MSWQDAVIRQITNLWRGGSTPANTPRMVGGDIFMPMGIGNFNAFANQDVLLDFCEIPEINAIINMDARMFATGILKVVNRKGKEIVDDPVAKMLKSPNWMQDGPEFMRQTRINRNIFGNEYIYKLRGVGLPVSRLFTLPPNMVKFQYTGSGLWFREFEMPVESLKYEYMQNGTLYNLDPRDIIHLNDNRAQVTDDIKTLMLGISKLEALKPSRQNLRLTYETLGVLLKNRGALGILSNASGDGIGASIAIEESEKEEIQKAYARYGGLVGQSPVIITSANLKWQQMSISADKLGLFQGKEEDFAKCLDAYGHPMELYVRPKGATYENQKEARKGAYQDTIIPNANEWVSSLNEELMVDRDGNRTENSIIVDYTHLPCFQDDLKARGESVKVMADALNRMLQDRAITIEEYKEEIQRFGIVIHAQGAPEPSSEAKDNSETLAAQAALRGSVGGVQGILSIQASVSAGTTTRDSALSMLTLVYGFEPTEANQLLGEPKENTNEAQPQGEQQAQGGPSPEQNQGNTGSAGG